MAARWSNADSLLKHWPEKSLKILKMEKNWPVILAQKKSTKDLRTFHRDLFTTSLGALPFIKGILKFKRRHVKKPLDRTTFIDTFFPLLKILYWFFLITTYFNRTESHPPKNFTCFFLSWPQKWWFWNRESPRLCTFLKSSFSFENQEKKNPTTWLQWSAANCNSTCNWRKVTCTFCVLDILPVKGL